MLHRDTLLQAVRGSSHEQEAEDREVGPRIAIDAQSAEVLRRALARVPMLAADINEQQLQRLVEAVELRRFQPRETIVRVGDLNDYMYVIRSGRVKIETGKAGQHLLPGDAFAEEALDSGDPCEFNAIAQGSVEAWRLHRRTFKNLQLSYGDRLRDLVRELIERKRAARGSSASAVQNIARQALLQKEALARIAAAEGSEFSDVASALLHTKFVGNLGKGMVAEVCRTC